MPEKIGTSANTSPAVAVDRFFEFSLLGLVASGYFAVAASGYLDTPTAALTALGLAARALIICGVIRFEAPARVVAGLTLGYMAFYLADYAFLSRDFLAASVHLVFFLAVLRIITARTARDHIFVAVIAFIELLAASILSTSLSFFVFLALFLMFAVATFTSAEIRRSARRHGNIARGAMRPVTPRLAAAAVMLSIGILTLTGGMFFLLPRTARAAFQHLVPEGYRVPGFSNEMRLGEIGKLRNVSTPVLHVRMWSANAPGGLKWRGNALSRFDGRRWFNTAEPETPTKVVDGLVTVADNPQRWRNGTRISYEVRLHSIASDALFFAGTPEFIKIDVPEIVRNSHDGLRLRYGKAENVHYGVHAFLDDGSAPVAAYQPQLSDVARHENLQLPEIDPRIRALARRISSGAASEAARARAIESYLRRHYGYTTELPKTYDPDPLATFLFQRRKGHCEYFASAMAVMLRSIGIPARVATGFQSGVYNPVSGWYVVRASDAHSWVEAWIPGAGWVAYDPTPPAAAPRETIWTRAGFYLDAAETFWHEWVLNYDLDRQLTLAAWMETGSRDVGTRWYESLRDRLTSIAAGTLDAVERHGLHAVLFIAAAIALWFWGPVALRSWVARTRVREAKRGGARPSDATLLYERMLRLLARRGYTKPAWTTPAEFARQIPPSPLATAVREFTAAYHDLRYGGDRSAAPRMIALLESLAKQ
ncbi:MAG: DUF3488 and DUF4129 domain-containing transglutaminase family protein [bacterium]|jgi:transglutaminase-like putative cysteine protease/predicted nucleic acid-binding protein